MFSRTFPSWVGIRQCVWLVAKLVLLLLICFAGAALAWRYQFWAERLNPHAYLADWAHEADPALRAALSGHLFAMYGQPSGVPLMMPFALLIRLPALAPAAYSVVHAFLPGISHANGWWVNSIPMLGPGRSANINFLTDTRRYEIGAVGLMILSMFMVIGSLWYRSSRRQRASAVIAVIVLLFMPLTGEALRWSHPEEFLLAILVMGALLAAARGRWMLAMAAVGLAFASKQPAWLLAPTLPFMLPPTLRLRGLAVAFGLAIAVSAPFLIGHLSAVLGSQSGQLSAVSTPSAADPTMHISIWGALGGTAGVATRWFIPVIALLLPLMLAWKRGWQLTVIEASGVFVLVLLVRAVFDPFDISYYALPAVGALVALEQNLWLAGKHMLRRRCPWLANIPLLAITAGVVLGAVVGAFNNDWDARPIALGSMDAWEAVLCVFAIAFAVYVASLRRRPWPLLTALTADLDRVVSKCVHGFGHLIGLAESAPAPAPAIEEPHQEAAVRVPPSPDGLHTDKE